MKLKKVSPEEKLVQVIRRRLSMARVQLAMIELMPEDAESHWGYVDGLNQQISLYEQLLADYARAVAEFKCHGWCMPISKQTRLP